MTEVALRSLNVGGFELEGAKVKIMAADVELSPESMEDIAQYAEKTLQEGILAKELYVRDAIQRHLESIQGILIPPNIVRLNIPVVMGFTY